MSFNPRKWHETQDFDGDRVVMMTYTPRTSKLNQGDKQRLRALGFHVPERDQVLSCLQSLKPSLCKQQYIVDLGRRAGVMPNQGPAGAGGKSCWTMPYSVPASTNSRC